MKTLLILIVYILIAGCTALVKTADHEYIKTEKVVYVSSHYTGDESRHIGDVVRALEKYNFEITKYGAHADYDLEFLIADGHVEINLKQGRKIVVSASSYIYSHNFYISRTAMISSLVGRAVEKFSEALEQTQSN